MLVRVHSAAAFGIDARILDVEVDLSEGLPSFTLVGLPDAGVREARERVRSALRNGAFPEPRGKITVNLAPAAVRKAGVAIDLPLAVAFLALAGIQAVTPRRRVFVGELGLGGEVRPLRGALCLALAARDAGFEEIVLPAANAEEARAVDGIGVAPVRSLAATVAHLLERPGACDPPSALPVPLSSIDAGDFAEVRGQALARRALEIAAAGGHHVLLSGPPGSGKTMLARRLPSILPRLGRPEAIEVTKIHSIAGALASGAGLVTEPPFRSPHHGISAPGLVGGGTRPGPGEISLAHRGVLFLDELPEFRRDVLEGIRQPLEERRVCLVRVGGACVFPSDFLLVAAMNPCPCGFAGDARRMCRCAPSERVRYRRRVSGPLLDRVDLHVRVPPVAWSDLDGRVPGEPSAAIRERVIAARDRAGKRRPDRPGFRNADLASRDLESAVELAPAARKMIAAGVDRIGLSARAVHRALRVARTIADLDGRQDVASQDVAEALGYRQSASEDGGSFLDSLPTRPVRSLPKALIRSR